MMKMKAAVMYGPNDIRYEDVNKPECPDGGILLKVMAIGLCGSDIRNLTSDSRKGAYPHIYGHEVVGVVTMAAPSVTRVAIGDRIFIHPAIQCMRCESCISGHSEACQNTEVKKPASAQGGFADYMPIPKTQIDHGYIFQIPDHISFEQATLGEPLSSVYTCLEKINVKLNDIVVIIGAGPIGYFLAKLSKLRGAKTVVMVEINDTRLQKAKEFGVDFTVNSLKEDPIEKIKEITNGRGADKVISANPSTAAQSQSIFMARPGGIVVFFGGVPKGAMAKLDTNHIHYNNLWIYGHYASNGSAIKNAFELAVSENFPADQFISGVLPLSQIKEAVEMTKTSDVVKIILKPNT